MNLLNRCTMNELKLLESLGINIEDRDYSHEEIRKYEIQIEENIMNRSLKNNEISKAANQYSTILNKMYEG